MKVSFQEHKGISFDLHWRESAIKSRIDANCSKSLIRCSIKIFSDNNY